MQYYKCRNRRCQAKIKAIVYLERRTSETDIWDVIEYIDGIGFSNFKFSTVEGIARAAARELGRLAKDGETILAAS